MLLLKIIEFLLPKSNHNKTHKTNTQIRKEKDERERLLWELAEEYEEED